MSFKFTFSSDPQRKEKEIISALKAVTEGETDLIANLSNTSAVIQLAYGQANWVGFYILKGSELVLGPFQGKPACIRIPVGKGVCGTAAKRLSIITVPDVHKFPGHIACDDITNSEVVLPIFKNGKLFGVLDIDSPIIEYFSDSDIAILDAAVKVIESFI